MSIIVRGTYYAYGVRWMSKRQGNVNRSILKENYSSELMLIAMMLFSIWRSSELSIAYNIKTIRTAISVLPVGKWSIAILLKFLL